uniref:Enoyl reductase (ER) domain-containing protein n=1 Tax=Tetradesmus obliquus TaxID=3088 RepID=A0A383WHE0_TETOB|eukprot:jgi/Sobl393_1/9516/SZX76534.1
MQAAVIKQNGGAEVLELVQDFPLPARKPGQVLVKLHSSSVNPVDTYMRSGSYVKLDGAPCVLGGDLAGVVVEADEGSRFKQGDHVAALTPGFYPKDNLTGGTYAQYAIAEESHLALLPAAVPLDTAGGLPLVGLTAWQSLMDAKPKEGQRCLVFAASGGVGHVAVQLAKSLGLVTVGVAGPKNTSWVKEQLGADEVVDYTTADVADVYGAPDKHFDIIIDCLDNTPERLVKVMALLKPTGHYSYILNRDTDFAQLQQWQDAHKEGKGPSVSVTSVTPNGEQLQHLFGLWEAGKLKLEVAKVFPLAEVADAHRQVETWHTRGKVVLAIPQDTTPISSSVMQAAIINKTGGPDVLQLVHDFQKPSRGPGQVLVQLHSSSVNPVDTAARAGHIPDVPLPCVIGGDLAGVVVEADEGSRFKQGDHVAALTPGYWPKAGQPQGTYAQYVAVEESHLALLPAAIPLDTAGGLPLVGLTAWQSLMDAKPKEGQRCLVFAASGGVGHVAVQLAKSLGLVTVGVAGPKNTAWVKQQLGADEVVDYTAGDFAAEYSAPDKQFDVVVDSLGNKPERMAMMSSLLKPSGHYSHIMNAGSDNAALQQMQAAHKDGKGPGASLTLVKPNGKQLETLFELWEAGTLKLEVHKVFPLDQVADAHRQVETGHTRGKVVLAIPQ